jgi:hypothetical protein
VGKCSLEDEIDIDCEDDEEKVSRESEPEGRRQTEKTTMMTKDI